MLRLSGKLRLCCAGCSLQSNPAFVTADKNIAAKRRKFKNDHFFQWMQDRRNLEEIQIFGFKLSELSLFFLSLNNPSLFITAQLSQLV